MPDEKSILVVDDDIHIGLMIQRILEVEGYRVAVANSGKQALELFSEHDPCLVLLDVMLPDMDGYAICAEIRKSSLIPILMVTAKSAVEDKVEGLKIGADDYITKPFSALELTARIEAALRRAALQSNIETDPLFRSKDLIIDFESKIATIKNKILDLTATEFKILYLLAKNADSVVPAEDILKEVWGEEYITDTHLLQVNIGRIRQKLKDAVKESKYIETKPNQGYILKKNIL